ncbi:MULTISPECIES: sensor histidine kinase [unclassified Paraburkholderia]|uniref:sensor histidine kinase n=1 Tax=unclassified Paraburkholderia TaxID=2615204 RepID=UPI002AB2B82F|nr:MULTISPECIES: ATP-binding protein [unclassified Paraburkholderia]
MDGLKRILGESLQVKLSSYLLLAILLVASIAGTFSFMTALDEAHELQDDVLRQVASLAEADPLTQRGVHGLQGGEDAPRIFVQSPIDKGSLPIPVMIDNGLHTLQMNAKSYRVLVRTMRDGSRIAVAQDAAFRDEIARDAALRTILPLLILVPILVFTVVVLVRRMFAPITALASEIDLRAEEELHAIEAQPLPREVRPFALAINRLLERVDHAMATQRRFIADAAHELRSPLTALSLQAERLANADIPATARERLGTLRRGIERTRNLLEQLLTLARAQASSDTDATQVSVQHVFRSVLEDLMPLAEVRRIDLGIDGVQDATIATREHDLFVILKNLVDNAIRYSDAGGLVDLSVNKTPHYVEVRVVDNGPGIPEAERERVFAPFYRALGNEVPGSGLGLSIVQTLVKRMNAQIFLTHSDEVKQRGLCVSIRFPAPDKLHTLKLDGS